MTGNDEQSVFEVLVDFLATHSAPNYGKVMRAHPQETVNKLIAKGLVAVLYEEGDITLLSATPVVSFTDTQIGRLEELYSITPDTHVIWFADLTSDQTQNGPAEKFIYSGHPEEEPEPEPKPKPKPEWTPKGRAAHWIHPGELSPKELGDIGYRGGPGLTT